MRRSLLLALACASLAATTSPSSALSLHRTETATYVAPVGDSYFGFCTDPGINVVCFDVQAADKELRITINDVAFGETGFGWQLNDADGVCVGSDPDDPLASCDNDGFACDAHTIANVPTAARELVIFIDGPVNGALDCEPGTGAGITGDVEVKFYRN